MPNVLIVDDEGPIRQLLELAFSSAGYAVQTAFNAEQAIELCQSRAFDALLSDVVMPGMNGHELARWAARHCPAMRTVLMSGCDVPCDECPYSPRCPLLRKPFNMAEAIALVQMVLNGSHPGAPPAPPNADGGEGTASG